MRIGTVVILATLVAGCSTTTVSAPPSSPSAVAPQSSTASLPSVPSDTPEPTTVADNGDGCPAPTEPLRFIELEAYGDGTCFKAGATVVGWWQQHHDGSITIGPRQGSIWARGGNYDQPVSVSLRAGQALPSESGYGTFFATKVGDRADSISDAVVTALPNAATGCPNSSPIPLQVYLDSLTSCYTKGRNVTIAGWRDTLDGLCGCGGQPASPAWLTDQYGFGWLFVGSELVDNIQASYLTLYAPKPAALGVDSGRRPTWTEITGHFDDPAAATCHQSDATAAEAAALRTMCASHFVVTRFRELAPPAAALSFCPGVSPVPVADLIDPTVSVELSERFCFGGGDVTVAGWFDPKIVEVGLTTTSTPAWLEEALAPGLWISAERVGDPVAALLLFVNPKTAVSLPTAAGPYLMTGHFDDPAAATCMRTDPDNVQDWSAECRAEFVVTGVSPALPN